MPLPKRKPSETKVDFMQRCMNDRTMRSEFPDEEQRYAVCQHNAVMGAVNQTYTDYPQAATANAKRALKYRDESGNPKGCGTAVGWTRANQLAKREPISRETIGRMAAFDRHRQNKDVPYEDGCGGLMWDAWGGTEGIEWAQKKLKEIDGE
jgi:hypothetical protein